MEHVSPSEFEERTVEQLRRRVEFMAEKITPDDNYTLEISGVSLGIDKVEKLESVLPTKVDFDVCAADSKTSITLGFDNLRQQLFLKHMEVASANGHGLTVKRLNSGMYLVFPSSESMLDSSDRISRYMKATDGDVILSAYDIDTLPNLTNEHSYALWLSSMLDRASRSWTVEESMLLSEGVVDENTGYTMNIERARGHGKARYSISALSYTIEHYPTPENTLRVKNSVSYVFENEAENGNTHALVVHENSEIGQFDEETDTTPENLAVRPLQSEDDIADLAFRIEYAEAAFNEVRKSKR